MPIAIRMPDFGTAVDEIRIVKWLVPQGAAVSRGTMLVELETDKAATELESIAEGVLLEQCAAEDTVAKAGDIIAWVGQPGETVAASAPTPKKAPPVALVAANLATKLGVDLAAVRGTGEDGRITREDVLRAHRLAEAPALAPGFEELSRTQSAVARAVARSHAEIPQLTLTASLDMTAAERLRAEPPHAGRKAFHDALFVKAMAGALAAVPLMGARL